MQLIYGRQLQRRADEGDALNVSTMSHEEREALKARLVREHPGLAEEILGRVS